MILSDQPRDRNQTFLISIILVTPFLNDHRRRYTFPANHLAKKKEVRLGYVISKLINLNVQ